MPVVFDSAISWSRVGTSRPKWHAVRYDAGKEPREQHACNMIGRGDDQNRCNVEQLFQCVFEADPQRIGVFRRGRLDHQPPHQKVKQHVPRDLVGNALRSPRTQARFHALRHFQLVIGGFDFPATMIQPLGQSQSTFVFLGGQADPSLAGNGTGSRTLVTMPVGRNPLI